MKIVVLGGCGDMGSHAVRDLIAHTDHHVIIADYRVDRAKALADELGPRANGVFVNAEDPASLASVLGVADVAMGCVGPFYHFAPKMAQAAIAARVNYVDICDDWGPIEEVFGLDEAARSAGVTLICGLGWTPGITNVMARAGANALDQVDTIGVYWGGGAADSEGLAVVAHVLFAINGRVPTYRDGQWVDVPAGADKEVVDFPDPLGPVHVSHCGHPEPMTIPRTIPANTVFLKGGLTPNWNNWLGETLVRLGLGRTHKRIMTTARIVHSLEGIIGAGGVPCSGARVDVIGVKDGQPHTVTYACADTMGRLTGIPAAVGADLLARAARGVPGLINAPGVYAPEAIIEPGPFFAALAARDIVIHQYPSFSERKLS
ncbi:MAG: saccharopine dehydrogenase NADP-binding domain-containing protein [Chloroflexi bacterium]|nr:saccharopine dehydrogenase NADP-binding domain-containing protein [Chloroflexota bacterium]MBU1748563.1 saccharopine dehydrogenase NADP-binding domain-containing protein [Chloroflexota bacterium]MBU1878436.1 saccharopine dehydrogenase NADP-binding domain-containing protein [Chloroflexota bacterium]